MKRIYVSLLISICTIMAQAQTIAGYEYWFDNHFDSRSSQNTASGSVSIEKISQTSARVYTYSTSG